MSAEQTPLSNLPDYCVLKTIGRFLVFLCPQIHLRVYLTAIFALTTLHIANAEVSPLESDVTESYYYTDHYEVVIDKRASDVWPHIVDMGAWMAGLKEVNPHCR